MLSQPNKMFINFIQLLPYWTTKSIKFSHLTSCRLNEIEDNELKQLPITFFYVFDMLIQKVSLIWSLYFLSSPGGICVDDGQLQLLRLSVDLLHDLHQTDPLGRSTEEENRCRV